ncbi:MAG: hypothetical protein HC772_00795 [Leptolyngbyaceae cyanobacterium CRU_2_3]|nr:hypothetical protein [Leptolyngbyaceae cyanobacterium CRU_2_3]
MSLGVANKSNWIIHCTSPLLTLILRCPAAQISGDRPLWGTPPNLLSTSGAFGFMGVRD